MKAILSFSSSLVIESFLLIFCAAFFLTSCVGKSYDLYEKVGFEKGMRPNEQGQVQGQGQQYQQQSPMPYPQYNQANAPQVNVVPDYYYHQPIYPQYGAPGSRAYNNPYAFQPPAQYPYYDADQYYIPPSNFYSGERDQRIAPSRQNSSQRPLPLNN